MAETAGLRVAQRLERLPMTSYQRRIFLIIATAWLFDSIDLAMLTFVLAPISKEFRLNPSQTGILASASFAGMFFGASIAGMLADRLGRKSVFQISMIIWGLASLLCATAGNVSALAGFRFLLGLGMGAEFPIAQSLVSELVPAGKRGKYIALLEGFWPLGFIVAGVVAYLLVPVYGWRAVFIVEGLPAFYVMIIRRQVPESPRWYESRGRRDDAEAALGLFEKEVIKAYGRPLPEPVGESYPEATSGRMSLLELFSPQYFIRTVMSWLLWFGVLLGYYGITTWMAKLLVDRGFTVVSSIGFVLLMTLWGVPGFFSASLVIEKLGRRAGVIGYIVLSAAAAFAYGQASSQTNLIIAGAFMQFFFFGMWSVIYAYTPELFPTRARATGCGTSSAFGRLGALIGPAVVPLIMAAYGTPAVFTLGAVAFLVAALVVLAFGPETKQRVLEEVSG